VDLSDSPFLKISLIMLMVIGTMKLFHWLFFGENDDNEEYDKISHEDDAEPASLPYFTPIIAIISVIAIIATATYWTIVPNTNITKMLMELNSPIIQFIKWSFIFISIIGINWFIGIMLFSDDSETRPIERFGWIILQPLTICLGWRNPVVAALLLVIVNGLFAVSIYHNLPEPLQHKIAEIADFMN